MDWMAHFEDSLALRDAAVEKYAAFFETFAQASRRAIAADSLAETTHANLPHSTPLNPGSHGAAGNENDTTTTIVAAIAADRDVKMEMVKTLRLRLSTLETRLAATESELNKAQQRARERAEEQYMKTHHLEGLHDEILALTMQLNLSEDRAQALETENKRIVENRVNAYDDKAI